jgi:hypothetical protein
MASEFRGGFRTEVARYELASYERTQYEEFLKTHDLEDLKGRIDRGEPNPIDSTYGGEGYTYFLPETIDLGRVKVTLVNDQWNFKWEDRR